MASHNHFENLPVGTTVILDDGDGDAVAVEYNHGAGVIIANGLTDAWRYAGFGPPGFQNLKFIANDIAYQNSIETKKVGGELLSVDSTVFILAGAQSTSWIIPVLLSGIGIGLVLVRKKSENS